MAVVSFQDFAFWYAVIAGFVAAGAIVLADTLAGLDAPWGASRVALAVLAGAVWPVLVVGAVQWLAIRALACRMRRDRIPRRAAPTPTGARH